MQLRELREVLVPEMILNQTRIRADGNSNVIWSAQFAAVPRYNALPAVPRYNAAATSNRKFLRRVSVSEYLLAVCLVYFFQNSF